MKPSAKTLILDLLSTLRRGSMPVAALVEAAALFGVAEGSLRVALSRLAAAGRVERDERGAYRLGKASEPVQGLVRGWRELESRNVRWRGAWIGVSMRIPESPRGASQASARALRLLGFRALTPELQIRPANLREGIPGVRSRLADLGLPAQAPVFELRELDPALELRARELWDGGALLRGYREALADLAGSAARLPQLPEADAMVESFLQGGRVLQRLVLDPLLPAPLVDVEARRALAMAMRDYDRLGRAAWAPFLGRYGIPHHKAPAHTRWKAA